MERTRQAVGKEKVVIVTTVARGVTLTTGSISTLVYLLMVLAPLAVVQPGLGQQDPVSAGVRLQAGIEKEDVDGDLPSAMDIYQKIAEDNSAPRNVRARALLRLAGCEERLGRQAKQVYQQIVRDYADQPVAAQARKRLAFIRQQEQPPLPRTMSMRRIDSASLNDIGGTDTDGERAVYWSAGHLYFGDLAAHTRHLIGDFKEFASAPTRDFSMVALNLKANASRPHTLAVIKTDGTGYRELFHDDAKKNIFGMTSSFNMTWSWDDKYIEICDFHPWSNNLGQVWVVSVADGQRRVVADQADGWVRKAVFSPDGQFIAYEAWPRNDLVDQTSRVFVVPIHGGEPRLVFETAPWQPGHSVMSLMDWTADGRYLAVHDVRQGKSALYLAPIKNGSANGQAAFVRYGEFDDGYTSANGALVIQDDTVRPTNVFISIATIDSEGHLGSWKPIYLNTNRNPWPSFSPDGSQIAYEGLLPDPARRSLLVRNLATGQDREIYESAYSSLVCQYSIHNPRIFCSVEKERGESELLSVDVESGAVEHIANFPQARYLVRCSEDDQTFYLSPNGWRWGAYDAPILAWNRSTGRESVIAKDIGYYQAPSPDGRTMVGLLNGTLSVRPISGGDWEPLVSGVDMNFLAHPTPDGKWVLYQTRVTPLKMELYRIPITGGQPQHLGSPPSSPFYGRYFFSLDGHQVLAWGGGRHELWLLENFEPPAGK